MTVIYLFIILLFFMLAGCFAGSEIGFISADRIYIRKLVLGSKGKPNRKERRAGIINFLFSKRELLLSSLLIGTNITIITSTALATGILKESFGYYFKSEICFLLVHTFIMTLTALLIVEIFPKTVFRSKSNRLILLFSKFLLFIYYLFYIPSFILSSMISPFIKEKNKSIFVTRDEISSMAEAARDDGAISDDEIKYIQSILEFDETGASEIIVPLVEMFAVSEKTTVKNTISIMEKKGLEYVTVYRDRIDNVAGYFTLKDAVFSKKQDLTLLLKKPQFVPFSMPVDEVFLLMRDNELTVVYVVNEYGGVMGYIDFVTIVDEIMGDIGISDNLGLIKKISANKYMLEADIEIEELAEKLKITLPEGDYETLNGFIVSSMQKIPEKNDKYIYKNYEFQIVERNNRNICKVLLIIHK